jgi:hypothetical protein
MPEIEHFFVSYNEMEGRRFHPKGRHGPSRAERLLQQGVRQYGQQEPHEAEASASQKG